MKKLLLLASVCMLALFAGCTNVVDNDKNNQDPDAINFMGTTDSDPATKVLLGDATAESIKVPILWEAGDQIGIYSDEYLTDPTKPAGSKKTIANQVYVASTTTPATATGFSPTSSWSSINTKNESVKFYAYFPQLQQGYPIKKETVLTTLKTVQTYDPVNNKYPEKLFMVAAPTVSDKNKNVNFKFTNAFAMFNVGIMGDILVDSIAITGFTKTIVCDKATVDITKAPASGTTATDFDASGFLTRAKNDVSETKTAMIKFGSRGLRLNGTVQYVPFMIMPTEYDAAQGITIKVYTKTNEGEALAIDCVVGKNTSGVIKTNDILYANLSSINSTDHGITPPATTIPVGTVVFNEDFSWIPAAMVSNPEDPYAPSFFQTGWAIHNYSDPVTWAESRTGLEAYAMTTELMNRYVFDENISSRALVGLYGDNGRLILGSDGENGSIVLPIDLQAATVDLKVTFKASHYRDVLGNVKGEQTTLPIIVDGPGVIKDLDEVKPAYDTRPRISFTPTTINYFTEYTAIIKGANSSTRLIIGDIKRPDGVYGMFVIDDIKITIADAGDSNNITGVASSRALPKIINVTPADGNVEIGWSQKAKAIVNFTVTGPWELKNLPSWLVVSPDWNDTWGSTTTNRNKDVVGNEVPTTVTFVAAESNTGTDARSATVTLEATNTTGVSQTFTITQAAAPAPTTVATVNFGTVTETTPLVKTTVNWGATLTAGTTIIENFDADGNNTKGELTNYSLIPEYSDETTVPAPSYVGATPEGCYNFKEIKTYEVYDSPSLGFGFSVPTKGKTAVIISFAMYTKYDVDGYNGKSYINVTDSDGYYNNITDIKEGWNIYSITLPPNQYDNTSTFRIYPPTDGRGSRTNTVLIDDIKVEVQ